MIDVISCIAFEHDLRLVGLAATMCVVGAITVVNLFERCRSAQGQSRIGWCILVAMACGASIWSTHFIAMLAYQAVIPVKFDTVLTMVSLIVPMMLLSPLVYFVSGKINRNLSLCLGIAIGAVVSSIHYIGMSAYRVDGIVEWNAGYLVTSLFIPMALFAVTFNTIGRESDKYKFIPILAFTAGVVGLHFTGMTAMEIIPLDLNGESLSTQEFYGIAMATAMGGFLVLLTGLVSYIIDNSTQAENSQQIQRIVTTDSLTGLPNREALVEYGKDLFETYQDSPTSFIAGLCININEFKELNDTHGYQIGDEVLKTIARRAEQKLARGEFLSRIAKDDFAAMTVYQTTSELEGFIDRLMEIYVEPIMIGDTRLELDVSIGVAGYPSDAKNFRELGNNAELAMSRAKSSVCDSICYYDAAMDDVVRQHREIVRDLRHAIARNELQLHYQMQACARTGELRGFEALLRWNHPEKGPISPALFIPIAEECGMIGPLGEWVLKRACQEAASWDTKCKVAVNISPLQLMQTKLPTLIHQTLIDTGLSPGRLEIELTETAIFEDRERSVHVLRQIKALGVNIALDDFGTGYSSLEILRTFPFDKIKLDRFFMNEIETSSVAKAFLRSVIALGHNLSVPVLAEGVETEKQLRILQEEGCDTIQGFLLHKPSADVSFEHDLDFTYGADNDFDESESDNLYALVKTK